MISLVDEDFPAPDTHNRHASQNRVLFILMLMLMLIVTSGQHSTGSVARRRPRPQYSCRSCRAGWIERTQRPSGLNRANAAALAHFLTGGLQQFDNPTFYSNVPEHEDQEGW